MVDDKQRKKSWSDWQWYAMIIVNAKPYLRGLNRTGCQNLLLAFVTTARLQTRLYGNGQQVGHQYVEKALHHVAQTLQLAGYDDP
jgi:hypothetical protein